MVVVKSEADEWFGSYWDLWGVFFLKNEKVHIIGYHLIFKGKVIYKILYIILFIIVFIN